MDRTDPKTPTSKPPLLGLRWNPQGKRRVRPPQTTWRRSVLEEMRTAGTPWGAVKKVSQNGEGWGGVGEDRCHRMESVGEVLVRTAGVTEWRVLGRCW